MNEIDLTKTLVNLMRIKDIAEVLNKDESTIRKIGKSLFPNEFKNGITTYLNEEQVTAIKLSLGKNSELPKTDLEKELIIQQAMMFQAEKITSLQNQIDVLKPKAELAEIALRDESEHYSITEAGKQLGLRMSEMFAILRSKGLIGSGNLPLQKALDYGVLTLRTNVIGDKIRKQSVMTLKNIDEFRRRYLKTEQPGLFKPEAE